MTHDARLSAPRCERMREIFMLMERGTMDIAHVTAGEDTASLTADQAEETAEQNEELLQLLVRRVRDYAIMVLDTEGNIVTWNEGAEQIKGYRPEEIIGQHFSRFYSPEDRAQGKPQRELEVARRQGRFEDQGWRLRKDGSTFLANVNITALRDTRGKLRGYCKITRDITERRAAEKRLVELAEGLRRSEQSELARVEQLRLRDEFLSHVSHELRSPLASIHSFASIVADGLAGATNSKQDEYLAIILKNVKQLQAMIEDLLEVTHAQSGGLVLEPRRTRCEEAAAYTVEALKGAAEAREIKLSYEAANELPAVYADPTRLRQVMTILVDNAIKFTSPGGNVTVRICSFDADKNLQLVEVEDTGYGMSPQDTERIFDRLYQVPRRHRQGRRGLGLGLYIARELVIRMGGQIWVTSEPGVGSHFYFTVPVFSLEKLLAPVLALEPKPGHALLLFSIFIRSAHGLSDEAIREGRKLLKEHLRPETDVLLPDVCPPEYCDILFAVCFSRVECVDVLTERMLASLGQCAEMGQLGARIGICYDVLTWADGAEPSGENRKKHICAEVQQCINDACAKGRDRR